MAKKKRSVAKDQAQSVLSPIDLWMEYLFYAILVSIPLLFSRITFDQFDIPKLALFRFLIFIIFLLWAIKFFAKREANIRWNRFDFILILFLGFLLFSTFFSIHLPTALHGKYKRYEGLLTFFSYVLTYFLALQVFSRSKNLIRLVKTISLTAAIVALYGLVQYVGLDPLPWGDVPFEARRSFSTFGNPDLLAGYLVLALPITLAAYLQIDRNEYGWIYGISFFLVSASLLTALTRGAWVAGATGIIFFLVLARNSLRHFWKKILIVIMAFLLLFSIAVIYSTTAATTELNPLFRLKSLLTPHLSGGSRIEIWKAAFEMIKDRPLFGMGPDTFRLASEHYETYRYVKMVQGTTVADNAHNYLLQLAAGAGTLATLAFLVFLGGWLIRALRTIKTLDNEKNLFLFGVIAAAVGYFVHLFFGLSVVGSSSTFWIALAAVTSLTATNSSFKNKFLFNLVLISIGLLTLIVTLFGLSFFVGDYFFARGLFLAGAGEFEKAVSSYQTAHRFYPSNGRYLSDLGRLYTQAARNSSNFQEMALQSIELFKRAKAVEPLEADYRLFLANSYGMMANFNRSYLDLAIKEAEEVLARRPFSLPGNYLLGNFYFLKGDSKKSLYHFKKTNDISPNYFDTLKMIGLNYQKLGDLQRAKYYLEESSRKAGQR